MGNHYTHAKERLMHGNRAIKRSERLDSKRSKARKARRNRDRVARRVNAGKRGKGS